MKNNKLRLIIIFSPYFKNKGINKIKYKIIPIVGAKKRLNI